MLKRLFKKQQLKNKTMKRQNQKEKQKQAKDKDRFYEIYAKGN